MYQGKDTQIHPKKSKPKYVIEYFYLDEKKTSYF